MLVRFLDDHDGSEVVTEINSIVFNPNKDGEAVDTIPGKIILTTADGFVWEKVKEIHYFEYKGIANSLFFQGRYDFVSGTHDRFRLFDEEEDKNEI